MIIKNGTFINPRTKEIKAADIRIENGIIQEIGSLSPNPDKPEKFCISSTF